MERIIWVTLYLNIVLAGVIDRIQNLYSPAPSFIAPNPVYKNVLPFPKWLEDFTGLKEWPGLDPPYIPLEFIKFDKIPNVPLHSQGVCSMLRPEHCSFDCFNCVAPDDVYTCRKLSQTFDDGPTEHTPVLLNSLHSRTTFFTLGVQNVRYPEIYRDAMKKGHLMGSHTWSHKFLPSLSNEDVIAQIQWSIWSMNATANHLPKWFRPPYGGVDERIRAIVRQFGMQCALWNLDTFDWKLSAGGRTEAEILKEVKTFHRVKKDNGLILEHDVSPINIKSAIKINEFLGPNQLTVAQCVEGINYIKEF